MPASPNTSAHTDQARAASVPSEISVSMVAVPWRRFSAAARWNRAPHHATTTTVRTSDSHCQAGNCHAGTIASATTGTLSTTPTSSRVRSAPASSSSGSSGDGRVAPYPRCSTVSTSSSTAMEPGWVTRAFAVA